MSKRVMRAAVTLAAAALLAVSCTSGLGNGPPPSSSPTATPVPSPSVSYTWPPSTCGYARWPVKTGTDAAAANVNLGTVVPTTIADLAATPAPAVLPQDSRIAPTEDTVFQVTATLTGYKLEGDSDYHLILSDGNGHTMIAEIPDPACVGDSSPFRPYIEAARAAFDARFPGVPSGASAPAAVKVPVVVTGVGFFDTIHGQDGVAPNGIELHPVLSIRFD